MSYWIHFKVDSMVRSRNKKSGKKWIAEFTIFGTGNIGPETRLNLFRSRLTFGFI